MSPSSHNLSYFVTLELMFSIIVLSCSSIEEKVSPLGVISRILVWFMCKSEEIYKIVSLLNNINHKYIKHLIRGLLDSDGWVVRHIHKGGRPDTFEFGFSSFHSSILENIRQYFCQKLNKKIIGTLSVNRKNHIGSSSQLIIGGNMQFCNIYNLLYNNNYHALQRKKNLAHDFYNEYKLRPKIGKTKKLLNLK